MTRDHLPKCEIEGRDDICSRRNFVRLSAKSSLFTLASALVSGCNSDRTLRQSTRSPAADGRMPVIDYGLSFISGKAAWNRVRFWVESRTRILDEHTGQFKDYYQCASCKSENTFAKEDLFMADNYDFIPIFGPDDGVIFRRKSRVDSAYRQWRSAADMWGGQEYKLRKPRSSRLLSTPADIHKATNDALPLVAQTEISDKNTGLRAMIEFPIKTMNIRDEEPTYQIDTGPIALPDLSKRYDHFANSISLAFIAFNAPHFADFVIEDETSIVENGKETARVHHYSKRLSLPADNRLFAIDG